MKKIIILTLCFALVLLTQVQVAYPQVEPIGGVPIYTISGSNAPTFPKANGSVWDSVSDGNGGWYIGGSFATVGGQNIANLAHILSNGTVDTSFNLNPNGNIEALALSGSISNDLATFIIEAIAVGCSNPKGRFIRVAGLSNT